MLHIIINCYNYVKDLITYTDCIYFKFFGYNLKFHIVRDILNTIPHHVLIESYFLTKESLQFLIP